MKSNQNIQIFCNKKEQAVKSLLSISFKLERSSCLLDHRHIDLDNILPYAPVVEKLQVILGLDWCGLKIYL